MFNYFDKFNVGLSSIIAIYCSDFYSTFVHFKTQSKLIFSFLFIGGTSLGLFLVWSNYYDVDIAILITLLYIVSLFIIALLCFSPTVFASSTSSFLIPNCFLLFNECILIILTFRNKKINTKIIGWLRKEYI